LLEGQTDHSGTAVEFQAVSGSAEDNTLYTDQDGDFTAGLPEGIYLVSFSADGFIPTTLSSEFNFFSDAQLEPLTLLSGSIMEVSGPLDGNQHWTTNFQYRITETLVLLSGDTLLIDPGVDILFMEEQSNFLIGGVLYAMGTESDSITFTSGQPSKNNGDWKHLYFSGDGADGSMLDYTIVEYGGNEYENISINEGAEIVINNSRVSHSYSHGIEVQHSNTHLTLSDSQIHANGDYGLFLRDGAVADISGNTIYGNNGYGVYLYSWSSADISGNDIYNNGIRGVCLYFNSSADISGNTIYGNNYGIELNNNHDIIINISENTIYGNGSYGITVDNSYSHISGNDIYSNSYGVRVQAWSSADISRNNIHNNWESGIRTDIDAVSVDIKNNILWGNTWALHFAELNGFTAGYNCFYTVGSNLYYGDANKYPSAFSELITVNANGDSTDTWSNLFMDPMLTDIENGDHTPLEGSPVIDAGHPDDTDPDGSIADIGTLYYDWGTTAPEINSINADNLAGPLRLWCNFQRTSLVR